MDPRPLTSEEDGGPRAMNTVWIVARDNGPGGSWREILEIFATPEGAERDLGEKQKRADDPDALYVTTYRLTDAR